MTTTAFPGAVDSITSPTSSDRLKTASVQHSSQHQLANTAIVAVENFLNTNTVIDARLFGAYPNSGNDEFAHLQAAIDGCVALGGGMVLLQVGTYLVSGTLTINEAVVLRGANRMATIVKRTGATTTPVVKIATDTDQEDKIEGPGVQRMTLNGNGTTLYAVRVTSANYVDLSQLYLAGATTYHVFMDCSANFDGGDARDNQHCTLRDLKILCPSDAGGIRITGNTAADANTSHNELENIWVKIVDGDGVSFGDTDSNQTYHLRVQGTGGSGRGLVLNGSSFGTAIGHARHNQFHGIAITNGCDIYALGGTQKSGPNLILGNNLANNGANPGDHITSGAVLKYMNDDGTGNI